jgi:cytoskeletal protein RodZ
MKRCPECKFVYLDSDELCDLDGTQLIDVSDAEFNGAINGDAPGKKSVGTRARAPRRNLKALVAMVAAGLVVGLVLLILYFFSSQRSQRATQVKEQSHQEASAVSVITPQQISVSEATPLTSQSVEKTPSPGAKQAISSHSSAKGANISPNPVSTSANESAKAGPMLVRLNNGASIEADEVWRTREGVWYRRNGIVTLIKANLVKAIEKSR